MVFRTKTEDEIHADCAVDAVLEQFHDLFHRVVIVNKTFRESRRCRRHQNDQLLIRVIASHPEGGAQSGAQQLPNERLRAQVKAIEPKCNCLRMSEGGESDSFAKPL